MLDAELETLCDIVLRLDMGLLVEMVGRDMSKMWSEAKENAFRIRDGASGHPPKTLLTLYQRRDFDIARAGSPSPLAVLNHRHNGS